MKKKYWIWGLDGSGMEVDEKIVCRGQVTVSSDETYSSAINYRVFPRQFLPRGQKRILLVCLNLMQCVNNNFP